MAFPKSGESPLYSGSWDCFKKIVKTEGIFGLYKGVMVPFCAITPIISVKFFGYGLGKSFFTSGDQTRVLSKPEILATGAFAGAIAVPITAPGERIKCLLQIQQKSNRAPKYNGMVDCARQLYIEGGIRSIYKGLVVTFIRDPLAVGVYFLVYEFTKEKMLPKDPSNQLNILITLFAGGFAGIIHWVVGMPADVIKNRYQTAADGLYPHGIRDVYRELMAKEGVTALFKGFTPVMIRAFPANAACFLGFELAAMLLR